MANPEHLKILKRGVRTWNRWRQQDPAIIPDLDGVTLSGLNEDASEFADTYHQGEYLIINFAGINLRSANLENTTINFVNLNQADLVGTNLFNTSIHNTTFQNANLSQAEITNAVCQVIDFRGARLISSKCLLTDFGHSNFTDADLSNASLVSVNCRGANLNGAFLHKAMILKADFSNAKLAGAQFHGATLNGAIWGNIDLSGTVGLEDVIHQGPSTLGVDTVYRSSGNIPETFLRGCGVPESFIVQIPALVAAMQPIQFYSCFISYSSKDQKFAERLHADLQSKGVRCWYAPEDLKIGEKIRVGIDESIKMHDKLLLILSKHSIGSEWVEKEVEAAMERERLQKRTILFPIRLDDTALKVESGWAADVRRSRNIGDFRRWKSHDSYSKAFDRLLRDLKANE